MTVVPSAPAAAQRTSVSQIAVRGPALRSLEDTAFPPSRSRVRPFDGTAGESDELVAMATMVRGVDDEPLRLRGERPDHEYGIYCSPKAERPLVWQGLAHQEALIAADVDRRVVGVATENVRFELLVGGSLVSYTIDVALRMADGSERFLEVKRDERDLEDPDYAGKLAHVAEICRRCGIRFDVVLRSDIFSSDRHARNAAFVASRGFATVLPEHLRRLDAHRLAAGPRSTIGDLSDALEPGSAVLGEAIVHALHVRGRVSLDLTARLLPSAPLEIH